MSVWGLLCPNRRLRPARCSRLALGISWNFVFDIRYKTPFICNFTSLRSTKSKNEGHFLGQGIKFDRKLPKYGNGFFGLCYAKIAQWQNLLYTLPTLVQTLCLLQDVSNSWGRDSWFDTRHSGSRTCIILRLSVTCRFFSYLLLLPSGSISIESVISKCTQFTLTSPKYEGLRAVFLAQTTGTKQTLTKTKVCRVRLRICDPANCTRVLFSFYSDFQCCKARFTSLAVHSPISTPQHEHNRQPQEGMKKLARWFRILVKANRNILKLER